MSVTEITSKRDKTADDCDPIRSLEPAPHEPAKRRTRIGPFLITLAAVTLAALLGWAMWGVYMGVPWTRDATVRAYVVTMAPEVVGRIVELHVADNEYVRKGDLLMVIDPTNYTIAVSQAEAAVQQAQASIQNIDAGEMAHVWHDSRSLVDARFRRDAAPQNTSRPPRPPGRRPVRLIPAMRCTRPSRSCWR